MKIIFLSCNKIILYSSNKVSLNADIMKNELDIIYKYKTLGCSLTTNHLNQVMQINSACLERDLIQT